MDLSARIDAIQAHPLYRVAGVGLGLAVMAAFALTEPAAGLSAPAWRTAGVALAMALWWVGDVLPSAVTALVPIVAFPALGVSAIGEASAPYADPLIFLMLGGSVLGAAMQRVGLHERIVALLLAPAAFRADARRVLLALMTATAIVSSFVSNTATTLMLLPIALLLAERSGTSARGRAAFGLGLAQAASIGGVTTLIGTFPNAVFAKIAAEQAGRTVGFAAWLAVGVPFTLVALPLAWFLLARRMVDLPADARPIEAPPVPAWRPGERLVLAVWALAAAAWIFRRPIDLGPLVIPGWSDALGLGKAVDDGWVAMGVAFLLFLLPGENGKPVLTFRSFEQQMPWGVMLLLGGGFALAQQIEQSGLSAWLAGPASQLGALPGPLAVLVICAIVTLLSEVTSNTATTQLMLPLLVAGAHGAGVDPMVWMVPATIAASCGFMMPISTPPMAIVSEAAHVPARDMALAGLWLDVLLIVLAAAIGAGIAPLVFVTG